MTSGKPKVAVIGASGFAGAIAAELLYRHPSFELTALTARSDVGRKLTDLYPYRRVPLELEELSSSLYEGLDAAVVAYPHGASAPVVAELYSQGVRTVDLSADFRLRDLETYERWYGKHGAPGLLQEAVYGLPERYRAEVAKADLVANPGCYPTAALLALLPLAEAGLIADAVIDAKSGVSGAGRTPSEVTHFISANENVKPYGVVGHRHSPEITQELSSFRAKVAPTFVPHLVPLDQGELVSCYVKTERALSEDELADLYTDAYLDERFIELADSPPGVRDVRETNICRIFPQLAPDGRVLVFAAIDNLYKGAASQAVQNLNLMFGLDEGEGLR